jgi:Domain of unknown function (DUF4440)
MWFRAKPQFSATAQGRRDSVVRMPSRICGCLLALCVTVSAYDSTEEQTIREREKSWNDTILKRGVASAETFLSPDYFLAIAVPGKPLVTAARKQWLETLKVYSIEEMRLGEMLLRLYGDVATVAYPYFQTAKLNGQSISGDFLITDIWVKRDGSWKVAARYSSRFGTAH